MIIIIIEWCGPYAMLITNRNNYISDRAAMQNYYTAYFNFGF